MLNVELEFRFLSIALLLKPLGLYVTVAATFLNFYFISAILIYRSCWVEVVEFVFVSVPFFGEGSFTNFGGDLSNLSLLMLTGLSSFLVCLGDFVLVSTTLGG